MAKKRDYAAESKASLAAFAQQTQRKKREEEQAQRSSGQTTQNPFKSPALPTAFESSSPAQFSKDSLKAYSDLVTNRQLPDYTPGMDVNQYKAILQSSSPHRLNTHAYWADLYGKMAKQQTSPTRVAQNGVTIPSPWAHLGRDSGIATDSGQMPSTRDYLDALDSAKLHASQDDAVTRRDKAAADLIAAIEKYYPKYVKAGQYTAKNIDDLLKRMEGSDKIGRFLNGSGSDWLDIIRDPSEGIKMFPNDPEGYNEYVKLNEAYQQARAEAARLDQSILWADTYKGTDLAQAEVTAEPDFKEKSKYVPDAEHGRAFGGTYGKDADVVQFLNQFYNPDWDDPSRREQRIMALAAAGELGQDGNATPYNRPDYITEDDVRTVAYLYNTGDIEAARQYVNAVENRANLEYTADQVQGWAQEGVEHPIISWAKDRGESLLQAGLYSFQQAEAARRGGAAIFAPAFETNQRQQAREMGIQADIAALSDTDIGKKFDSTIGKATGLTSDKLATFLYTTGNNIADNFIRDLPARFTGEKGWMDLALVIMGSQVASNTLFNDLAHGSNYYDAVNHAAQEAIGEIGTEKLGGEFAFEGVNDNNFRGYLLKGAGAEALEEGMGALAGKVYEGMANNPHSDHDQAVLDLYEAAQAAGKPISWTEAERRVNLEELRQTGTEMLSAGLSVGPSAVFNYGIHRARNRIRGDMQANAALNDKITEAEKEAKSLRQRIEDADNDQLREDLRKQLTETEARIQQMREEFKKRGTQITKDFKRLTKQKQDFTKPSADQTADIIKGDLGGGKTIKGIDTDGNVLASDGSTVKASDVDWAAMPETGALYEGAMSVKEDYGIAPGLVYGSYDSRMDVDDYIRGVRDIAAFARAGVSLDEIRSKNARAGRVDQTMAQAIYSQAVAAGEQDIQRRVAEMAKLNEAGSRGGGKVIITDAARAMLENEEDDSDLLTSVDLVSRLVEASNIGVDVTFDASEANEAGEYTAASQGSTNAAATGIRIDLTAGRLTTADAMRSAVVQVADHELTHVIATRNPEAYKQLRTFVANAINEKGLSFDALLERIKATSSASGEKMSNDQAEEEAVAQAMERVITESSFAEEVAKSNPSLAERIRDFFKNFADKIKKLFGGKEYLSHTAQLMEDHIRDAAKIWDDALKGINAQPAVAQSAVEASEAAAASAEETAEEDAAEEETGATDSRVSEKTAEALAEVGLVATDGVVVAEDLAELMQDQGYEKPVDPFDDPERYSIRTLPSWSKLYRSVGGDQTVADTLETFRDKMIMNDAIMQFVPTGEYKSTKMGPLRPNQEYRWTYDMDATCPRTFQFISYRNRLQAMAGRPLTEAESLNLMYLMKRMGQEIPCTYCYVENKRIERAKYYLNWFKHRQAVMAAATDEEARKVMYSYDEKKDKLGDAAQKVFDAWRAEAASGNAYAPTAQEAWTEWNVANNSVLNFLDGLKADGKIIFEASDLLQQRNERKLQEAQAAEDAAQAEAVAAGKKRRPKKVKVKADRNIATSKLVQMVADEFGLAIWNKGGYRKAGQKDTPTAAGAEIIGMVEQWQYDVLSGQKHNYGITNDPSVSRINADALTLHRLASNYASSVSQARSSDNFEPYNGQLIDTDKDGNPNISEEDKQFIIAMGGFRKHSSNDFRIDYVLDYLQFYADLAAGGWTGHTYTKSVDFVKIFGACGDRINMSIAMETRNGQIVESLQEGMKWSDARDLRDAYEKNVGVMAMVTDNAQLSFALNSDWIDMIIPFHASGLPKEVWYNLRAWFDYSASQNETYFTLEDMKVRLDRDGVKYDDLQDDVEIVNGKKVVTKTRSQKIEELYYDHFNVPIIRNADGTRKKPHFYPKAYTVNGQEIPGHNNDPVLYKQLCEKYGVHPRFYGVKVADANDNIIDVTDHPNYVRLIKETSRIKDPQEPIKWNFNEKQKFLGGMSPLDYALKKMEEEAKNGGFTKSTRDDFDIVGMFRALYLGQNRDVGWMPDRKSAKEGSVEDKFWARMDALHAAYGEIYDLTDAQLSTLDEGYQNVLKAGSAEVFENGAQPGDRNSLRGNVRLSDRDVLGEAMKGVAKSAEDNDFLAKYQTAYRDMVNARRSAKAQETIARKYSAGEEETPETQYDYAELDRVSERRNELQERNDHIYGTPGRWVDRTTGESVSDEEVNQLAKDLAEANAMFDDLVAKAPDPSARSDSARIARQNKITEAQNRAKIFRDRAEKAEAEIERMEQDARFKTLADRERRRAEKVIADMDEESLQKEWRAVLDRRELQAKHRREMDDERYERQLEKDWLQAKDERALERAVDAERSRGDRRVEAERDRSERAAEKADRRLLEEQWNRRLDQREHERELREEREDHAWELREERERGRTRLEIQMMEDRLRLRRYRETRQESADRKRHLERISDSVSKLSEMLATNTDKKHVPEVLKKPLGDFLGALNLYSGRTNRKGETTQKDLKLSQLLGRVRDAVQRSESLGSLNSTGDYTGDLYLPKDFADTIQSLVTVMEDLESTYQGMSPVVNMSVDSLRILDQTLRTLRQAINDVNRTFANASYQRVSDMARKGILYMNGFTPAGKRRTAFGKYLHWDMATPVYAFDRFGDVGKSLFKAITKGYGERAQRLNEIEEYAATSWTAKEARDWAKHVNTFTFVHTDAETGEENGITVDLTDAQIMSLYLLMRRGQGRQHALTGGIRAADVTDGSKVLVSQPDAAHLTEDEIRQITDTLTDRQLQVCGEVARFMQTCAAWGNEVSMRRFGYRAFGEKDYFPIQTDEFSRAGMPENRGQGSDLYRLLNMTFTKALVPKANNALVLDNIFSVFASHTTDMATYSTMALPALDMIRWYNYRAKMDDGTLVSTRAALARTFGNSADEYIRNFISDFSGATKTVERGTANKIYSKLMSHGKRAAVAANLSVVLKQPGSILRAAYVLPRAAVFRPSAVVGKYDYLEMLEHSGIARWKSMGYFDTNLARPMEDRIAGGESRIDKLVDLTTKGAEWMDKTVMVSIWKACKAQVRHDAPGIDQTSDEYFQKVTDLFEDIIYRTQVVDSTMTRSQTMRDPSFLGKSMNAFMAEPTLSYNVLMDSLDKAWNEKRQGRSMLTRETGARMAMAAFTYVSTGVVEALVSAMMGAWRDDDDYDSFWEKFRKRLGGELMDSLNPINSIPLLSAIRDAIKGESSSVTDSGFSALAKAAKKISSAMYDKDGNYNPDWLRTLGKDWQVLARYCVSAASYLSGLPGYNAAREAWTAWNNLMDATGNQQLKYHPYGGNGGSQSEKVGKYYDALRAGDAAGAERIKKILDSEGITDEKFSGQLAGIIKGEYAAGALSEEEAERYLIDECGIDGERDKSAYYKVQDWNWDLSGKKDEYEGKFGFGLKAHLKDALLSGDADAIQAAKAELRDKYGYDDKEIESARASSVTELQKAGLLDSKGAIQILTDGGTEAKSVEEFWDLDEKKYKAEHANDPDAPKYSRFNRIDPYIDAGQDIPGSVQMSYPYHNLEDIAVHSRQYLLSQYKNDEIDRPTLEAKLKKYGHYADMYGWYWKAEEAEYEKNHPGEQYHYIDKLVSAMDSGADIYDTAKSYFLHGKSADAVSSQLAKHYKPLYKAGNANTRAAIKQKMREAWRGLGYNSEKVESLTRNLEKSWTK